MERLQTFTCFFKGLSWVSTCNLCFSSSEKLGILSLDPSQIGPSGFQQTLGPSGAPIHQAISCRHVIQDSGSSKFFQGLNRNTGGTVFGLQAKIPRKRGFWDVLKPQRKAPVSWNFEKIIPKEVLNFARSLYISKKKTGRKVSSFILWYASLMIFTKFPDGRSTQHDDVPPSRTFHLEWHKMAQNLPCLLTAMDIKHNHHSHMSSSLQPKHVMPSISSSKLTT